jgi:glycosyltransferase involved in cell wall biosynthesis
MDKIDQSILDPSAVQKKVIPNGVNQAIFKPGDRVNARRGLALPEDAIVLLFSAYGIINSRWKDYQLMRKAIEVIGSRIKDKKIIFIALGQEAPDEVNQNTEIKFIPFVSQPEEVARFYQAADIYLHGAKAETFPNSILEALACAIPVVATAVGGIPEQIKGWKEFESPDSNLNRFALEDATGVLIRAGNAELFANAIVMLIGDDAKRNKIGENAAKDAKNRFSLQKQSDAFLEWYREIITAGLMNSKKIG